jgi:hypothetical protein
VPSRAVPDHDCVIFDLSWIFWLVCIQIILDRGGRKVLEGSTFRLDNTYFLQNVLHAILPDNINPWTIQSPELPPLPWVDVRREYSRWSLLAALHPSSLAVGVRACCLFVSFRIKSTSNLTTRRSVFPPSLKADYADSSPLALSTNPSSSRHLQRP